MMRVYFDLCCLKRPFDDKSQDRVRLEAEAVMLLLQKIDEGRLKSCLSDVIVAENALNPDPERRTRTAEILSRFGKSIRPTGSIEAKAEQLEEIGFRAYDALHLASAAAGAARVLLTCDDNLLRLAARNRDKIPVPVQNPVSFLRELGQHGEGL